MLGLSTSHQQLEKIKTQIPSHIDYSATTCILAVDHSIFNEYMLCAKQPSSIHSNGSGESYNTIDAQGSQTQILKRPSYTRGKNTHTFKELESIFQSRRSKNIGSQILQDKLISFSCLYFSYFPPLQHVTWSYMAFPGLGVLKSDYMPCSSLLTFSAKSSIQV